MKIGENTKVKLVFENRTGKKIIPADDLTGKFILERTSVLNGKCSWNNCFYAFPVEFESKVKIPNRGKFEAEIDLVDLFWADSLDSNIRKDKETMQQKNFFKEVMSGKFNLRAELYYFSRSTKVFDSNKILVTVETEKKYRELTK